MTPKTIEERVRTFFDRFIPENSLADNRGNRVEVLYDTKGDQYVDVVIMEDYLRQTLQEVQQEERERNEL